MTLPSLSIVIPAYNRLDPLLQTLASIQALRRVLACEVLLIDDGSEPPLRRCLPEHLLDGVQVIEQANGGSIKARLHGLSCATGDYLKFLDSDDQLNAQGVLAQLQALAADPVDVLYGDIASRQPDAVVPSVARRLGIEELALDIQPAPHAPIYARRALLAADLAHSRLPADRLFCATGDFWLYANLLLQPLSVAYRPDVVGSVSEHVAGRYSDCWEQLGLVGGSLLWCLACLHQQHPTLRSHLARVALRSLCMLPLGTPTQLSRVNRASWELLDPGHVALLEMPSYHRISRLAGFDVALWLARWRRQSRYRQIQTMPAPALHTLCIKLDGALRTRGFASPWPEMQA